MDAFVEWFWGTGWFWVVVFWAGLVVNGRAAFKLLLDWKGMLTTWRFVDGAYASLDALPDEATLEHEAAAPVFVHVVPAWEEPAIATTLRALLDSRYPHGKLHVVVVTKEAEERAPHPLMEAPTAELVRRFRAELPPWQQKQLTQLTLPGEGRKAQQLNWALRPAFLQSLLDGHADPARVWVGVSDADSIPDPNTYRWIAADILTGGGPEGGDGRAYQGVTLSLANVHRLGTRGRVCAVQQSSIFTRVSIARLINERRRVAWFARLEARAPRLARLARPVFEFCFRRAQLCRHVGNKAVEWPTAALVYPVLGFLAWHLAHRFASHPVWFALGVTLPPLSLGLTVWVGGIVTQRLIERLTPHCPRPVDIARTTLGAKLWGTFRCQTYWLLATRGAWRVLWALGRTGRYEAAKTDRVAPAVLTRTGSRP